MGPPGAGKGTQAQVVAAHMGVPHVSTGDIFRANVSGDTALGREAKRYMDAGELVPDAITNAMVTARLNEPDAADGFLLDGYPRNSDQAVVLDAALTAAGQSLDAVVEIVVGNDEVVKRLLGRAATDGRADDTEQVIRHRLTVYLDQTAPLVGYYRGQGLLHTVDGVGAVTDVTERILAALAR